MYWYSAVAGHYLMIFDTFQMPRTSPVSQKKASKKTPNKKEPENPNKQEIKDVVESPIKHASDVLPFMENFSKSLKVCVMLFSY